MRRSNITGYGALEASHGERGLIDSYHIIDADMESSLRTTKRRTRTKRQQNAMKYVLDLCEEPTHYPRGLGRRVYSL